MLLPRRTVALLFLSLPASLAWADEPAQRHGAVQEQTPRLQIGLTWVSSISNDPRVGGDNTLSTDFVVTKWFGDNMLTLYAEGSTTPPSSPVMMEGNADAGTAVDYNDNGRFQVSELHIKRLTSWGEFTYGPLIDPASYLDNSEVANDETSKFLAFPLVHNSSIEMPNYTVGLAMHHHSIAGRPGFTLFVGGSHGLADNPDRSYSELFDLGAPGKGVFAALEGYLTLPTSRLRLGAWTRTDSGSHHGIYANADLYHGWGGNWNLRWGQAEGGMNAISGFTAVSWERVFANSLFGLGYADQLSGGVHATTSETYWRFTVDDGLELTPSVQWLVNPGFDTSGIHYDTHQTLYHLRLSKTL